MHRNLMLPAGGRRPLLPLGLALLAPLLLAACDGRQDPAPAAHVPAAEAERVPPRQSARRILEARIDMPATADGGRAAAFPPAWRGEVVFEGGASEQCGIKPLDDGELAPGGSYRVRLVCARRVTLPEAASGRLRVLEEGREVASGSLTP